MKIGDRVKYIGRSVQVAQHGELGVVVGSEPKVVKFGENAGTTQEIQDVAWDIGGHSWCWPAELEVVEDGPAIPAPPTMDVEDLKDLGMAATMGLDGPDLDSYRRVQEDIAAMEERS